jgi:hypothetical protein
MLPHSFFPIPNPAKIGEYIGGGFELGITFARSLTTVILDFIGSLGKFIV